MKRTSAIILDLFIGIMSIWSWLFMAILTKTGDGLASNGFESLKFFTVLSNLMNGGICLVYAYWLLRGKEITEKRKTLKLAGTTAVGLTFLTVMVFLGPLYGYGSMFRGANLWLHLILPLLSFFVFLVPERGPKLCRKNYGYCLIPVLLYETGYILNMVINGIGTWPDTNDFYGFLSWGYGIGAVIAIVILLITGMIAAVLGTAGGCRNNLKH